VGDARVGMLIGLELWMTDQARFYGEDGVHIIAVPRVDRSADADFDLANQAWLDGGRITATASGVYCISSSRGGRGNSAGGAGWVIAPDGQTLATTSPDQPFTSIDVDLSAVSKHPRASAPMGMPLIESADVRPRR
jgi:N-carbamoylputrescine amidase